MDGFFTSVPSKTRIASVAGCGACDLGKHCRSEFKGKVSGKGKKKILLVFDHPEICEDDSGEHWSSSDDMSALFVETIAKQFDNTDLDLEEDCWRVDAVQCCPRHKNKKFTPKAVPLCRPTLMKTIKELQPKIVVLFGSNAVASYFKHRAPEYLMFIDTWHGHKIPDHEMGCFVFPCYGSSTLAQYVSIKDGSVRKKETYKIVEREISGVLRNVARTYEKGDIPLDYHSIAKKKVKSFVYDHKAATAFLRQIKSGDNVSIDYENSSVKPDFNNQFIKCAGIYVERLDVAGSFIMDTRDKEKYGPLIKEWTRILRDASIKKVGQNCKYEERWSRAVLHTRIKGWVWDTMLGSHCIGNSRKSYVGLKFQTAVNFGVMNYNGNVERGFKLVTGNRGHGENAINGIDAINPDQLCAYNGLDVVFTWWLYKRQVKKLDKWENYLDDGKTHIEGAEFLLRSTITFADMEEFGCYISMEHLESEAVRCGKEVDRLEKEFKKTELYKKWKKAFPRVNLDSNKQIAHVLYNILGLEQKKKTDSGDDSTDKEALLSLGLPDLAPFFERKLLMKAIGTYINQLTREIHGFLVHPSFNLHIAATFRSSCNAPNFQNVPIRNKSIGIIIRGAYISRHGKKGVLIEADLKGAEVSVAACYNHDPNFIRYVADPKNDMHKDTMALVMKCDPQNVTKELRHIGKNKFVFPQFYGDWYKSCAEAIWAEIQKLTMADGTPAMKWLDSQDVFTLPKKWKQGDFLLAEHNEVIYDAFVDHLGEVEDHFWHEMFPDYTEWKETWWKQYLQRGYVDSFTGFRFTGLMDKKKTINYPIQGDAYHLNQHGINIVNSSLRKRKAVTRPFNQIHDSGVYDSTVDEFKDVILMINNTMNVRMRKLYPWINVPIVIEFDVVEPGGSWFHKKAWDLEKMDFAKK